MKAPFSYVVLRYMHDVFTREFINVAVLLYSPGTSFLRFQCISSKERLRGFFPGADCKEIMEILRFLEGKCISASEKLAQELNKSLVNASEIAYSLLPIDDSALQWSTPGGGITDNPERTLRELFDRMVTRHEKANPAVRKEDRDVWTHFEKAFRPKRILTRLQEKILIAGEFKQKFEHTWQAENGILHLFRPLTFDLVDTSEIVGKALDWSGRVKELRKAQPDFLIYLLLGAPESKSKMKAFEQAKTTLIEGVPGNKRILMEEEAPLLADDLAREMKLAA